MKRLIVLAALGCFAACGCGGPAVDTNPKPAAGTKPDPRLKPATSGAGEKAPTTVGK